MTPAEKYARDKTKNGKAVRPERRAAKWQCRLREYRERLNLTLRDLERATGVTNGTISNMEAGFETTLGNARAVADFFGATVYEIWPEMVKL